MALQGIYLAKFIWHEEASTKGSCSNIIEARPHEEFCIRDKKKVIFLETKYSHVMEILTAKIVRSIKSFYRTSCELSIIVQIWNHMKLHA